MTGSVSISIFYHLRNVLGMLLSFMTVHEFLHFRWTQIQAAMKFHPKRCQFNLDLIYSFLLTICVFVVFNRSVTIHSPMKRL